MQAVAGVLLRARPGAPAGRAGSALDRRQPANGSHRPRFVRCRTRGIRQSPSSLPRRRSRLAVSTGAGVASQSAWSPPTTPTTDGPILRALPSQCEALREPAPARVSARRLLVAVLIDSVRVFRVHLGRANRRSCGCSARPQRGSRRTTHRRRSHSSPVPDPTAVLNGLFAVVRAGGGMGAPGIYTAGDPDPEAETEAVKQGTYDLDFGKAWIKSPSLTGGQAPVVKSERGRERRNRPARKGARGVSSVRRGLAEEVRARSAWLRPRLEGGT